MRQKPKIHEKICKLCFDEFSVIPAKKRQKYCSPECWVRAMHSPHRNSFPKQRGFGKNSMAKNIQAFPEIKKSRRIQMIAGQEIVYFRTRASQPSLDRVKILPIKVLVLAVGEEWITVEVVNPIGEKIVRVVHKNNVSENLEYALITEAKWIQRDEFKRMTGNAS